MASGTQTDQLTTPIDPGPVVLSVRVDRPSPPGGGDHVRVHVAGELDLATAGVLSRALLDLIQEGWRRLDVELAGVRFCDGAGLGALQSGGQRLRAAGGTLTVHDPCWSLRFLLDLFELDQQLQPRGPARPDHA
ncbi:STAS domain-containing protein [Aquipuribacter hungaricus]|uniref:STAS domain-containing protein n=1 Tax=Aquipuribacter hungaricus TaxID=545624 RepID=A0ABV7WL61_9MICO